MQMTLDMRAAGLTAIADSPKRRPESYTKSNRIQAHFLPKNPTVNFEKNDVGLQFS